MAINCFTTWQHLALCQHGVAVCYCAYCSAQANPLDRNAIIEECAQVAENFPAHAVLPRERVAKIAAAIRALKDKPP